MALNVIGAGFGRTGTLSLKLALEKLEIGNCYHMSNVLKHPDHATLWSNAAEGEKVDWEVLLSGYSATVDWPGTYFWRELINIYPEVRVILTIRDSEKWYKSMYATIYQSMRKAKESDNQTGDNLLTMANKIILEQTFDGRFQEKSHAIAIYERHNEAVQRTVPQKQLLVYEVSQGWEPLCRFLERPVPDIPFPKTNTGETYNKRLGRHGSLLLKH
jgi:hypothetical protein